jgi:hypothetical protein
MHAARNDVPLRGGFGVLARFDAVEPRRYPKAYRNCSDNA